MIRVRAALGGCMTLCIVMLIFCGSAFAAGIRVVPSTARVLPGGDFYVDIVADSIPADGLGGVQFRLNVSAPGGSVVGVTDLGQAGPNAVAVASPLLVSQPTATRSGIGDFFWNGRGDNGILVMDNESLMNGTALYTFAHTNGANPPSGSGSIARFMVRVGSSVTAEHIDISLSDVMLLDGGPFYPLDYNTSASVELRCMTKMPFLLGLNLIQAQAALASANLLPGSIYELDNQAGSHPLNVVLEQAAAAGSDLYCQTPVNLAINIPPAEVGQAAASDKSGDDIGVVLLSWTPPASADVAGYRVYQGSALLKDLKLPAAGVEIGGLPNGVTSQLRVTTYDTFGNESAGVSVAATPLDDVPPTVTISGVTEGAYYRGDITPQVGVFDTNLASQSITLNGTLFVPAPITADGAYTLIATGTDRAGNQTTKSVRFTIDKTPPAITVTNVSDGAFYNTDIAPAVTVTDANLKGSNVTMNGQPYASGSAVTAEGSYTLAVSAEDLAGNTATRTVSFIVDKTSPVSTANVALPQYTNGGVTYISGRTFLTISAQDNGVVPSGVAGIEYGLDGAQSLNSYSAPVTLAGVADGSHTVTYRAYDRATNREIPRALAVTVDTTPPDTTMTRTGPNFALAGGVYAATSATTFNLQATDLLSGMAKTEYQIDGGAWTVFAPFTLAIEGQHNVGYRSTDNVGNVEGVKTLVVTIDNTPPVSQAVVGAPQYSANGNLYVSSSTGITISATDNASGVRLSQYSVDSGAFATVGGPVSLAAYGDGNHTVTYRSTDNLGNEESGKQLTVILDKTPPTTVITGSNPLTAGAVNTVSPKTLFTLTATDDQSGVRKSWYRIDGGDWQLYSAPFALAGMVAGNHTIAFNSEDNVGNAEPARTITVTLIVMDVGKEISLAPSVLVGAWKDPANKVINQGVIDTLSPILSSLGVNFHVVATGDDFTRSLRSGRYNTYLLVDYRDETVGGELREAVNYGDGLIFIKTLPGADPVFGETFGVKFTGRTTGADLAVTLVASPLSETTIMRSSGKAVVADVVADTAAVYGYVNDKGGQVPALIFNQYGNGKAVLYSYDLMNSPDRQKVAGLIANSITLLRPQRHNVRALDSVPIDITVSNSTAPVGLEVAETLPAGTTADTIVPQGTMANDTITWQQSLASSAKALFSYFLDLPDAKGAYTATSRIRYGNSCVYLPCGSYDLTLSVENDSAALLQEVIAALNAISVADANDLVVLSDALNQLGKVDLNPADMKGADKGVQAVTGVAREIEGLSTDTTAIRLKLDELLKILEKKWYLLSVKGR
ncbi:MAG TPA: Ig-like domain-containing protein [Geobacteraceae bacterium]